MTSRSHSGERGSSVIVAIMALGVTALIVSALSTKLANMSSKAQDTRRSNDVALLKKYIDRGVDCAASTALLAGHCYGSSTRILLKSRSTVTTTLVKNTGAYQAIGNPIYVLNATCEACGDLEGCPHNHKIVVRYSENTPTLVWKDLFAPGRITSCEVPF